jgi:hypothetical protein
MVQACEDPFYDTEVPRKPACAQTMASLEFHTCAKLTVLVGSIVANEQK